MKHLLPKLFWGFGRSVFKCDTCILAKSQRVPFLINLNRIPHGHLFDIIHTEVWGPSPITRTSSNHWFVTFIDDCTRMIWLYFIKK